LQELDGVHGLIDWSRLEQLLINIHSSTRGEKAWPPLKPGSSANRPRSGTAVIVETHSILSSL